EGQRRRGALEEPNVDGGSGQGDMAEALAAHDGTGHFHAALVARDPLVADLAVFAAVAFIVLGRAEDALAEEAVFFRALGAVVDRLRLQYFAIRPFQDILRGSDADAER